MQPASYVVTCAECVYCSHTMHCSRQAHTSQDNNTGEASCQLKSWLKVHLRLRHQVLYSCFVKLLSAVNIVAFVNYKHITMALLVLDRNMNLISSPVLSSHLKQWNHPPALLSSAGSTQTERSDHPLSISCRMAGGKLTAPAWF